MAAYLFPWNSQEKKKWDVDKHIQMLERGRPLKLSWDTGNAKGIHYGDLCFFVIQGEKKAGLFGWGEARNSVYQLPHSDPDQRKQGNTANRVDVEMRALFRPDLKAIPRNLLVNQIPGIPWEKVQPGMRIPVKKAKLLLQLFKHEDFNQEFNFSPEVVVLNPEEISGGKQGLPEGAATAVLVNSFERNPKARKACLNHYGYACMVCGFDFEKVYGKIGKDFIHVHHLTPLSEIGEAYEVDPIADLRPVCPNCHAMLHRESPPLSIQALQSRIKKGQSLNS